MPAPKKNPLTNLIKKSAKKAVVKVKPKPNLKAEPKSNVKVKPAARQKPNKYDPVKDEARYFDSVARGASKMSVSQISKGKLKDARAFKASKKSK